MTTSVYLRLPSMTPREALHTYFGYDDFRPLQAEIIESVLSGKDTLALMPTGGGKSICFQIPTLVIGQENQEKRLCLVITPAGTRYSGRGRLYGNELG